MSQRPAWGEHCRGYNLQVWPTAQARLALSRLQSALIAHFPGWYRTPAHALHVSVAPLISLHDESAAEKDQLWQEVGPAWTAVLADISAAVPPFQLCYDEMVVSPQAVIALGRPVEPVNQVRELVRSRLPLPSSARRTTAIVHTTLFRAPSPTGSAAAVSTGPLGPLGSTVGALPDGQRWPGATMWADEMVVVRELVYPSLETEVLARLPLGTRFEGQV